MEPSSFVRQPRLVLALGEDRRGFDRTCCVVVLADKCGNEFTVQRHVNQPIIVERQRRTSLNVAVRQPIEGRATADGARVTHWRLASGVVAGRVTDTEKPDRRNREYGSYGSGCQ